MNKAFILAILLLFGVGCSTSTPPDRVIDEQTYKEMFMEFAIIDQMDQQVLQQRSKVEYRQLVYEHYGVSQNEFLISHEYYELQVEQQLERVEEMSKILRIERDSLTKVNKEYERGLSPQ